MDFIEKLDETGIVYKITKFPDKAFTSNDVAIHLGIKLCQVAKAMIVKTDSENYILALLPGDKRLNLEMLSSNLEISTASIAKRDEVKKATGMTVGAVTPLIALVNPNIKIYVDSALSKEDWVNISSGDLQLGITLRTTELIDIINGIVMPISE